MKSFKQPFQNFDIDLFNHAFNEEIKGFKDFISQHYSCSMRDDTPYWQAVTSHHFNQNLLDLTPELYRRVVEERTGDFIARFDSLMYEVEHYDNDYFVKECKNST